MFVRQTQRADGDTLRSLRLSALADAPYAFGAKLEDVLREPAEKFVDDALRHSSSDSTTSFLAFSDELPIGMIGAFFEQPSQRPFICSLWVEEAFRGNSATKKLLQAAIEWLSERGAKSCFAWVSDDNHRAISFYKKCGFIETNLNQPRSSDPNVTEHLYVLKLGT